MSIVLDPIHAAAQASQSRQPLCKILSCENVAAIPFNGELLSTATISEQHPDAKVHSGGRLFVAFMVGPSGGNYLIRYGYTDTARTFFTYVDLALTAGRVGGEVTFCERADGSVGIIWDETYSGTRTVKYRAITVTGVDLAPAVTGTIFTQATSAFFTGPVVERMADDSYLMVYGLLDGTHYHLYRRTSADFVTWAAASEIDTSGLTDTLRKANPALLIEAGGDVWLLFDYLESTGPNGEELTNVYYASSSDKLATASAAAALTNYTDYSERGEHPAAAQKDTGEIYLVFTRLMASLHIDKDSTGWRGSISPISNMHIDVATQKLYVVSSRMSGPKQLVCVAQIDLATWTIDKAWDTSSTPAFPDYYISSGAMWDGSYHGDGVYVPIGSDSGIVSVLNAQADTITNYAFYDFTAYGIAQNVTWTPSTSHTMQVSKTWIDAASNRLYVALVQTGYWILQVGWIDLTAAGPTYTFTTVVSDVGTIPEASLSGFISGKGWIEIVPSADIIIVSLEGGTLSVNGNLRIYSLTTGGLWKNYTVASNPTFPKWGLRRGIYNAGLIVGDFTYTALYGQVDYRGLCIIDTATDVITYTRPPWASVDDYAMHDIALTDDGAYIISCNGYGITLFDGTNWTLFSNTTLPGLTPSAENFFANPLVYNSATDMIIAGHGNAFTSSWSGLVMFSRDGYLKQATYRIGTNSGGWTWTTASPLVQGFIDYEASVVFDPDDHGLFAFWTNKVGSELSIKWDKEMPSFDLTPYLLRGQPIERSATIDPHEGGWDSELTFTVADGHLFDSSNSSSLLRQYLSKGRMIAQAFGDKISGVDYWEAYRMFTVSDDGEITYQRDSYPVMQVAAETPRRRWEQIHIINSAYYQATPETIIASLLTTFAGIAAGNISLGTWSNSATIEYQFVDVSLADAVNMVAIHFGYAIRDGANGVIEAVKITDVAVAARTYTDNTKLVNASPRNRYSSFTNRWIVQCEERSFTELLMAEELAGELNASHRWNTGTKTYRVNYTQGNKIFRNPRLEVVDSVQALAFSLAGGCHETLMDISHDEVDQTLWDTYCDIQVSSPDLTWALIAALGALAVECTIVDGTAPAVVPQTAVWVDPTSHAGFTVPTATMPSTTIPIGRVIEAATLIVILNILAATGNFYYRIYGQPVVKVRRTVSAQANDTAMQVKMGQAIPEQTFQDPLCGSAAECQLIADFRKTVGMGERARWSAEMITDMQNQEGDTISVIHPESHNAVTVFMTDLKTELLLPETEGSAGHFQQSFEGWRR